MPSMFSRRRGSSNPPVDRATTSAAVIAAGSAYLQSSPSHTSLSAAAAGAALRSRATSPEPVANLVTKRMARRGSVSSVGSGSVMGSSARGGVGRGGMQRQNSGGSMADRTFRSPSPGRSNGAVSPAYDAPPVPALPKNIPSGHKRSASLEPPQRITSPAPTARGGRGASVDRASMLPPATARKAKRLSNVAETPAEADNANKRNFSRPLSAVSDSPTTDVSGAAGRYTHGTGSWYTQAAGSGSVPSARPKTSDGVPAQRAAAAAGFARQEVQNAADRSVKKNKSLVAAEGSHFAQASRTSNAYESSHGASYGTGDTVMVFDPSTRTFVAKPRDTAKEHEPQVSNVPELAPPLPGTWDPNTRRVVPGKSPDPELPVKMKKQRPAVSSVETKLQPPPRNPARFSPDSSPSSPRAAGILHHQPSVVREDPEGEEAAAVDSPVTSALKNTGRTIQTSAGPARMYVAPGGTFNHRSSSLDIPRPPSVESGRGRIVTASPARSAHFSQSPVMEAIRHNPPLRSISPVKSAMKQSPASSERAHSPLAMFSPTGYKLPPSDASDTTSVASADGLPGPKKKKKSVRVSFDELPEQVEATSQARAKIRERSPAAEDEMEDLMQPRPALPSFGSVRRGSGRGPEMPEKVTEMAPERHESSNDHVVGGILASDYAANRETNGSLAPDVTSKEAIGYASDESEEFFKPEAGGADESYAMEETRTGAADESRTKTRDFASEIQRGSDVPAINLLPPTPGEEVGKGLGDANEAYASPKLKASYEGFSVPGGWADSDDKNIAVDSQRSSSVSSASALTTTSEPTKAAQPTYEPRAPPPDLDAIDEDSDDSAAFSDAAEDPSEFDNGGFASMDAIAVSPVVYSSMRRDKAPAQVVDPPDSPSSAQAKKRYHEAEASGDWGSATAYWSNLSRQQKAQIERGHFSSDDEETSVKKPRRKKSAPAPIVAVAATTDAVARPAPVQQSSYVRQSPAQQQSAQPTGSQTSLPKTMRGRQGPAPAAAPASGDSEVHMRRSMRDRAGSGGGGMMSSMRSGPPPPQQRQQSEYIEPRGAVQKKVTSARPVSAGGAQARMNGLSSSRTSPDAVPTSQGYRMMKSLQQPQRQGQPASATNRLEKQLTNDSDSESSFKKKRRSSAAGEGRYSMKRSMRAGSIDQSAMEQRPTSPTPVKRGGGAFSIRSLSPSGSMFSNRGRGDRLRESLRTGSVDVAPKRTTLRGNTGQPTKGGFGSSMRPSTAGAPAPSTSRFKSRFGGDSDDEDERPSRSVFKSRFVDSDEDEPSSPRVIPADLTPVRGIPRKQGQSDGDSTDLEGEDDGPRKSTRARAKQNKPMVSNTADVDKAMEAARRNLGMPAIDAAPSRPQQGGAVSKGSFPLPAAEEPPEPRSRPEDVLSLSETPRKRGFLGSILRRNRGSTQSVQQAVPSSPIQGSPIQAHAPASPLASPPQGVPIPSSPSTAKLVRRGSSQPKMKRGESYMSTSNSIFSTTATYPPVPKVTANGVTGVNGRPNTSDGPSSEAVKLARTMRPDLVQRSQSGRELGNRVRIAAGSKEEDGSEAGNAAAATYSARTGKKKRFPMLRRAFGLND
ncbi:hypothetical protein LTR08_006876 [Meristemomyces frigidus]|nr:hypothetical protein LTR08_006876 [Meristemomyces frigidus]